MGIKLLRGTTGRSRREVFSRELVDFETKFERVWQVNEGIGLDTPDSRLDSRNGDLEVKNGEESRGGGKEPGADPPSLVKMDYPPV